jgi:prolyl-tRNA synthetase
VRLSAIPNVRNLQPNDNWLELSGADIAKRSGLVCFLDAGFPCFSPLGQAFLLKLESLLRNSCNKYDYLEIKVPLVHRKSILEQAPLRDDFEQQFFLLADKLDGFMLSSTSEEYFLRYIIKNGTLSYRQMPIRIYQFQDAFRKTNRCEGVYKSYSFYGCVFSTLDVDTKSYLRTIKTFITIAEELFSKCGIRFTKLISKDQKSVEFLYSCPEGDRSRSDSIIFRKSYKPNSELSDQSPKSDEKFGSLAMGYEYKGVKSYNIKFDHKNICAPTPAMGTFGIGLQRCLCAILEHNRDSLGLCLPSAVRPWDVLIMNVGFESTKSKLMIQEIYKQLSGSKLLIAWDDRHDMTLKERLIFADFWGIPVRAIIGEKEAASKTVELRFRNGTPKSINVDRNNLLEIIIDALP